MGSGTIRIGLSGWSYEDWHGDFYPEDLPRDDELDFATARFPTLEINRTFYSLVDPKTMRAWYRSAPNGFRYAVKGSRFITHNKKLKGADGPLANFLAAGVLELKEKLGPILWQLGANLHFNAERVDRFLASLPGNLDDVADRAKKATSGRPSVVERQGANHRVRHVIEPRHESFFVPEMVGLARRHKVALAFSHSSKWQYTEEVTAGFVYLRLHGPNAVYASAYTSAQLEEWARRIRLWAAGLEPDDAKRITDRAPPRRKRRDVYCYFDNDSGGHAPRQATELTKILARGGKEG